MNIKFSKLLVVLFGTPLIGGCLHPSITAVNLNDSSAPEGMPYYLPKPYIIISKNIRYIPTPAVGLTQTAPIPNLFDSGSQPPSGGGGGGGATKTNNAPGGSTGGKKTKTAGTSGGTSNTVQAASVSSGQKTDTANNAGSSESNSPPAVPSAPPVYNGQVLGPASITVVPSTPLPDGLTPQTFYTYQIVFLPDLTQKYGLRVKGGVGEMRATLNMVNGWMFTGPGPVYFKDSSTAEIATANWTGADSALESAAKIVSTIYGVPNIGGGGSSTGNQTQGAPVPGTSYELASYAQIWIYEGNLSPDKKSMTWSLLQGSDTATIAINRTYLGLDNTQQGGGGGSGSPPPDTGLKDSRADLTKQVNDLISGLKIQNLTALRTSQQGTGYITTINRTLTDDENNKLAPGLKPLKVTLSTQQ